MLSKKEMEARLLAISMNTPDTAKKLSSVAEIVFGIATFIGIICGIFGIFSFFEGGFFAVVIGAIIFLTYWIIFLVLNGFSEIIVNNYKSAEYNKLQVEILAENAMKGAINKIEEDSLPQL